MNKEETKAVLTHLEYIKEKVKANNDHLIALNGRVRVNEKSIAWIKGIGISLAFVISSFIGFFMKE